MKKSTKTTDSPKNQKVYPTHKAKAELSKLIREALKGHDVIISKGSIPLVKLVPIEKERVVRQLGLEKGDFYMSDDFNDSITDFSEYIE